MCCNAVGSGSGGVSDVSNGGVSNMSDGNVVVKQYHEPKGMDGFADFYYLLLLLLLV